VIDYVGMIGMTMLASMMRWLMLQTEPARQKYGVYGFNEASMMTIWKDKKGYHAAVNLYKGDTKDGTFKRLSFIRETPEQAADAALVWMTANMEIPPVLMKTYSSSEAFPVSVWDIDKASRLIAWNEMGRIWS